MRYFIVLVALIVCSCAYATIEYDASTGSFAYNRMGEQEILDLYVKKDIDSTTVRLGKLKNDQDLEEVILGLQENINKALDLLDKIQNKIPGLF